jgi:hypothetical protein
MGGPSASYFPPDPYGMKATVRLKFIEQFVMKHPMSIPAPCGESSLFH